MARPRLYTLNEKYFDEIDTDNKAYLLGFIYADGCISNNRLEISLSNKDKKILEFIKDELEYNGPISEYNIKNNKYNRLTICSKKLSYTLVKKGILENKTYTSKTLPFFNNRFSPFLLGFFDGDGSIYKSFNKSKNITEYGICFACNQSILLEIKELIIDYNISSCEIRKRYNNDISCMLEIRGNINIEKMYNFLYNNKTTCYLERKNNLFVEFITQLKKINRRNIPQNTINEIKKLYISGNKQYEIANKLKIPNSSIRCVIQRLRKNNEILN